MTKCQMVKGVDLIVALYQKVLAYAIDHDLSTNGIKIYLHSDIADVLELEDNLSIEYKWFERDIPVVRDDDIPIRPLDDNQFETDIYIGDENWGKE